MEHETERDVVQLDERNPLIASADQFDGSSPGTSLPTELPNRPQPHFVQNPPKAMHLDCASHSTFSWSQGSGVLGDILETEPSILTAVAGYGAHHSRATGFPQATHRSMTKVCHTSYGATFFLYTFKTILRQQIAEMFCR